jgi:hypothetical protein
MPDNLPGPCDFFDGYDFDAHRHSLLALKATDDLAEVDHLGDSGIFSRYFSNQFAHDLISSSAGANSPPRSARRRQRSLPVGPAPPALNAEVDGSFKSVVTAAAFPAVTHATGIGVFRRFRQEKPFATFDAAHEGDSGSELHGLSIRLEA